METIKPKFKKGDRVYATEESAFISKNECGTVDEDGSHFPYVIWDNPQPFGLKRMYVSEKQIELMSELWPKCVKEAIQKVSSEDSEKRVIATLDGLRWNAEWLQEEATQNTEALRNFQQDVQLMYPMPESESVPEVPKELLLYIEQLFEIHYERVKKLIEESKQEKVANPEPPAVKSQQTCETECKFKIGDRVKNLVESAWIKKGATGTVNMNSPAPFVIWDSFDMLQETARRNNDKVWAQMEGNMELLIFKKGQRVRNTQTDDPYIRYGATGTVDEDDDVPFIIWDSPDMLTKIGQCDDRRWPQTGEHLELLIEESEQIANAVVHEPEIKPVQFATDRDTYVECTPEQRAEIIRVAREYKVDIAGDTNDDISKSAAEYPNLCWDKDYKVLCSSYAKKEYHWIHHTQLLWLPFDEFIARLKGEWVEPTEEPKTNLLYPEGLEAVVKDGEIPKSIWCNYNGTKYEYRPQRDYSHLVGKWVMRIGFSNACYTQWKWYKVVSDDNPVTGIAILDCDNSPITCKDTSDDYEAFVAQFDLINPLDAEPDELSGKWVQCVKESLGMVKYKEGLWYQVDSHEWNRSVWRFGYDGGPQEHFDLSNPKDKNPDKNG